MLGPSAGMGNGGILELGTGGIMRLIALLAFASALIIFAKDANEDLLSASRAGDLTAVKTAIENGAALETKTSYGQTPLYLAAMSGHEDVVRFLLDWRGQHRCSRHFLQGLHTRVRLAEEALGSGEVAGEQIV